MFQTRAITPLLSALLSLSLAAGCASPPVLDQQASGRPLALESFFPGRSEGAGVFVNSWTGSERRFSVVIDGAWNGSTLTLVEDFNYADGEKDRKTWQLLRTGPGTFSGTREDVVGRARAWTEGDNVRLAYGVRLSGWTVQFADVLALRSDGSLVNRATVSKWGIRLGTVELFLHKV
jgi:uncharacterized protein DUF3833